jgi:hypothetical protein
VTKLTPYFQYLEDRWKAGCHNRLQLWREICELGFDGNHRLVYIWAEQRRFIKTPKTKMPKKPREKKIISKKIYPWAASRAVWLLLKDEGDLKPEEKLALERMKQVQPKVELAQTLAHEFRS